MSHAFLISLGKYNNITLLHTLLRLIMGYHCVTAVKHAVYYLFRNVISLVFLLFVFLALLGFSGWFYRSGFDRGNRLHRW